MRVLIVEDDMMISMMMEDAATDAGHEVVGTVVSAAAAQRLIPLSRPDLLLVDINLADGETGCSLATDAQHKLNVPTIFVTGSPDKARVCDDAIGVLVKPFGPASVGGAIGVAGALKSGDHPGKLPAGFELFQR
jgi:two-component system, response regulator PdtaR